MSRLEIWAATPTPFDAEGRLDVSIVPAQVAHLQAGGMHGAFVTGTTGEFAAMSADERRRLVEAWAAARPVGFGLAAHVGGTEPGQAVELAAHAEGLGLDFIATVAPYYGEAPTIDLVVDHLRTIAAAAPATALCYYHIPSMTGSTHRPSEIVSRAAELIPTLRGVKFSDGDLLEYDRTRASSTHVRVYFGRDELLPAALSFGADAVIGSLYNGLAPIAHRVTEAFDAGDHPLAFELHRPFRDIASASRRHGGLGFVKELMNELTPDCGRPRIPWGPLHGRDRAAASALAPALRRALTDASAGKRATA
ncbi:dihydrodipicolinate synthase family protein [Actinopolymorpha sp. B9G3]|uniref:dihydrodipicolinate synthase family protein n=1 Tax=Actinopolymorpha sp. B9G3 TaxID=3158970 RepID=UPI0032D91B13